MHTGNGLIKHQLITQIGILITLWIMECLVLATSFLHQCLVAPLGLLIIRLTTAFLPDQFAKNLLHKLLLSIFLLKFISGITSTIKKARSIKNFQSEKWHYLFVSIQNAKMQNIVLHWVCSWLVLLLFTENTKICIICIRVFVDFNRPFKKV